MWGQAKEWCKKEELERVLTPNSRKDSFSKADVSGNDSSNVGRYLWKRSPVFRSVIEHGWKVSSSFKYVALPLSCQEIARFGIFYSATKLVAEFD